MSLVILKVEYATPEGEQLLAGVAQGDTKLRAKEEGRQKLSPIKVSTKYR